MKTPRFLLFGVPLLIVILCAGYWLTLPHRSAGTEAVHSALGLASTNMDSHASGAPAPGGHMRGLLNQLDLTDAQKAQIAQARQTYTDRPQRREAIMKILTPDQRAKFQQLRQASTSGTNAAPPAAAN